MCATMCSVASCSRLAGVSHFILPDIGNWLIDLSGNVTPVRVIDEVNTNINHAYGILHMPGDK